MVRMAWQCAQTFTVWEIVDNVETRRRAEQAMHVQAIRSALDALRDFRGGVLFSLVMCAILSPSSSPKEVTLIRRIDRNLSCVCNGSISSGI